ncbi:MAG: methyltransferase domain-containing protein [bacterium]
MGRVLDVGCGPERLPGAIGVDIRLKVRPSVCCDADVDGVRVRHIPFRDGAFEEIRVLQTIDHFRNIVPVMEELHRVAAPGARLVITVAHVSSIYSWSDPVHHLHLTSRSFLCFTDHPTKGAAYTAPLFRQRKFHFIFGRSLISLIPRFLCLLSPRVYEKHFSWMFPANDMYFEFEALK